MVYPAAGSHANKFGAALYLGSSADAGVGCDDTRGPHVELRPTVKTIPSDPAAARAAFSWIAFEGRWGELQRAFFNGPTGPNLKTQWTEPIAWSDGWRSRSYAVPSSGIFWGRARPTSSAARWRRDRRASSRCCTTHDDAAHAALLALLVWAATRTRWRPVAPLRVARRRRWGQILADAGRMYVKRAPLFLGIGVLLIPLGIVISVLQALVLGGFGLLGVDTSGEGAGGLVLLVVAVGTLFALLAFTLVQAATTCALARFDAGHEIGPVHAYRLALSRIRPLLGGLGLAAAAWVALTATGVLIPVAIWLAVRWALLAQVVELEDVSAVGGLRRSAEVVRRHWFRVASLVVIGAVLALALGPFVGALLILVTDAPLPLLNVVAGVVYAPAMPFVALTTTYVYFDPRVRHELADDVRPGVLPAGMELSV